MHLDSLHIAFAQIGRDRPKLTAIESIGNENPVYFIHIYDCISNFLFVQKSSP